MTLWFDVCGIHLHEQLVERCAHCDRHRAEERDRQPYEGRELSPVGHAGAETTSRRNGEVSKRQKATAERLERIQAGERPAVKQGDATGPGAMDRLVDVPSRGGKRGRGGRYSDYGVNATGRNRERGERRRQAVLETPRKLAAR